MRKIIYAIINDVKLGNNLDVYLTVPIAIMIAILGAFSIADQEIISSAILATLAILATSSIQDRNERAIIKDTLKRDEYCYADKFFQEHNIYQFKELIETSQSALFWGIHFRKTISIWRYALQQSLSNGSHLKFLLVKPESSAVDMSLLRHSPNSTKDDVNGYIRRVLRDLAYVGFSSNAVDRIQVRVIDFLPPYTIIAVNPSSSNGKISVLLASIRTATEKTPSFQIEAEKDRNSFDFFIDQFNKAWNEGEVVDLEQHIAPRL